MAAFPIPAMPLTTLLLLTVEAPVLFTVVFPIPAMLLVTLLLLMTVLLKATFMAVIQKHQAMLQVIMLLLIMVPLNIMKFMEDIHIMV